MPALDWWKSSSVQLRHSLEEEWRQRPFGGLERMQGPSTSPKDLSQVARKILCPSSSRQEKERRKDRNKKCRANHRYV
ncbi:hypothetical protein AVEN_135353-1 [Araneus ventricosus]|uniref:Uncharacterized protein n=1 Tax=Araneus ventricosus TaxID=182803 RepID=A0A4Y2VXQ6_ARAVE|nr:hypothetical protein AVEN_135353-1 [Araneus ventricosus]